jgi:hypothetical protein
VSVRHEELKDGTVVTSWTNRELLIRAVDTTLDLAQEHGVLMRAQAEQARQHRVLVEQHAMLTDRVEKIEEKLVAPTSHRDKLPSLHDLVEEVRDGIKEAVEEATSPGVDKRTSESERVKRAMSRVEMEDKAKLWDEHQDQLKEDKAKAADDRRKIIIAAITAVAVAIALGVGAFIWQGITLAAQKTLEKNIEHDKGLNEGKQFAPVVIAPIPASTMTEPPPPVLVPSASVKRHP